MATLPELECGGIDRRYSVALEYCGRETPRHVARFCGDWISQHETESAAARACREHATAREIETGRDFAALAFWDYLRGAIQYPAAVQQIRGLGFNVSEYEIRQARSENRSAIIKHARTGRESLLPQPY